MANRIILLVGLMSSFLAGPALAGSAWYLGAETGFVRPLFHSEYTYVTGGNDIFKDSAHGPGMGFIAGREFSILGSVALAVQGRLSFNRAVWDLDTVDVYSGTSLGGPAHLEYRVPAEYSLGIVPRILLIRNVWLMGEVGVGQGRLHLAKDSVTSTRYDFDRWTFGYTLGGGITVEASRFLDLYAVYRHTSYQGGTFTGEFPDGMQMETIDARAGITSVNVGIRFRLATPLP